VLRPALAALREGLELADGTRARALLATLGASSEPLPAAQVG
jgi:hypothetical protein